MKTEIETIRINEVEYVRKDQLSASITNTEGLKYVIVRADRTGVFVGWLKERNGTEVTLLNARRMWKWYGASLSEVAQSGTSDPASCKWPEAVGEVLILDAIEILTVTEKAAKTFEKVAIWKA